MLYRLAQFLAALMPKLEAQRGGSLMISLQLRQRRLRRRPQLVADAAQGHGAARVENVAQVAEEDALLVTTFESLSCSSAASTARREPSSRR